MGIVSIEKQSKHVHGEHARRVETYSLSQFMEGLHSDAQGLEAERDRLDRGVTSNGSVVRARVVPRQ